MKNFIILSGLLLLIFCGTVLAESEDGGYAGSFLKMAVQARPAGMGGAYIGLSDDAAGGLYNPAGMSGILQKSFTSSYRAMKLGRKLGYVSFVLPTKGESSLGISWLFAGYGEVTQRNTSGQDLGSTISSSEHDFGLTFAKQFAPVFGAGAKLNYYYKRLAGLSANSVGINLGMMFSIDSLFEYGTMEGKPITDVKVGLMISHIAARYPWNNSSGSLSATKNDTIPIAFGFGVSGKTLKRKLLLAADVEKNLKQAAFLRVGGEYDLRNRLLLRGGFDDGVLTAGLGYRFTFSGKSLIFNYAFSADRADEGSDHIFGFDFRF